MLSTYQTFDDFSFDLNFLPQDCNINDDNIDLSVFDELAFRPLPSTFTSPYPYPSTVVKVSTEKKHCMEFDDSANTKQKRRRVSRDTMITTTTATTTPLTNYDITQASTIYSSPSTIPESCFEASALSSEKNMEHIKLLKSPFHRDIRRAYPKLFVDAFNTWSVDHMKNVMNLMAAKDCQLIEVHPSKHRLPNRHIIGRSSAHRYNAIMLSAFPDAVYDIEEFKLKQVAHIPKLFDKIALRLMTDGDYEALDTYLLQVAEKASEEPTRGFILCGKYSFNGTKLLDIVVEQDHTPFTSNNRINIADINDDTANITLIPTPGYESKFKPNVMLSGTFVWTLNSDNKVSRFEYHSE